MKARCKWHSWAQSCLEMWNNQMQKNIKFSLKLCVDITGNLDCVVCLAVSRYKWIAIPTRASRLVYVSFISMQRAMRLSLLTFFFLFCWLMTFSFRQTFEGTLRKLINIFFSCVRCGYDFFFVWWFYQIYFLYFAIFHQ